MKDYIKSMYEQWVWISRMITKIEKKFWEKLWKERVKDIIEQLKEEWVRPRSAYTSKDLEREDGWLKNLVQSVSEKPYDYIAETWHIILKMDDMQYPILVSTIDAMIESYSKHWENLSWQQVQYKFSLTPRVWNFIKNAFNIYKDSIPFSIITLLDIPEDQLQSVAKEKADQLLESKMSKIYIDTANRLKDRKFRDFAKAKMWQEVFLEWLDEIVDKYERIELVEIKNIKSNDNYMCFITDAHIWKKWTQWIIDRFSKIADDLIKRPEKNIDVVFWWDIWELFLPYPNEMHPWQRLWMENIQSHELVLLCVNVLEDMIAKINNSWKKVSFRWILGNHWRLSEKKEYDPFRTAETIIYSFLQKIFKNTKINIDILWEKHNTFKVWNVKYLIVHWDWLSPAELNRLAIQEVEDWLYLCIVSWDKHHLVMKELSNRVMRIQSPALAWQWSYDKSLALTSLSWYLWFKENSEWMLDIWIHRLI